MTRAQAGFTLIELAVSMIIIALLLGGTMMAITAQQDVSRFSQTRRALDEAQEALLGFAVAQGRLPCAATDTSNGKADPQDGGACAALPGGTEIGYFPAVTLGIGPTDKDGFLIDAWGNRIRYTITKVDDNAFTTADKMKELGAKNLHPDLVICRNVTPEGGTCPPGATATKNAVAVIYSLGKNGALLPQPNEQANIDNGKIFFHNDGDAADDIIMWLSPYTLYNRMIMAGAL